MASASRVSMGNEGKRKRDLREGRDKIYAVGVRPCVSG